MSDIKLGQIVLFTEVEDQQFFVTAANVINEIREKDDVRRFEDSENTRANER